MSTRPTTPPTTPLAMAPTFVDLDVWSPPTTVGRESWAATRAAVSFQRPSSCGGYYVVRVVASG